MGKLRNFDNSPLIFSVASLTALIRENLTNLLPFVWVRGEVTDFSLSQSGHIYFSLRDETALVHCVWFAGRRGRISRNFDPLTGEVYDSPIPEPEELLHNGLEIVCAGSLNVYPPSGRYQIVVEYAEPAGLGAYALIFEQRRAKYEALGYFLEERKKKLPINPVKIALVTSLHGAAIHDFLKIASSRGISSRIRIYPVPVQGNGAAGKIAQAIEEINQQGWAQVIALVRGGGSREDLAEFNEEILIESIHSSRTPVITGIGHEIDISLADLTADARGATPTHVSQMLLPLRSDLWQRLDELVSSLNKMMRQLLDRHLFRLDFLQKNLQMLSPLNKLNRISDQLQRMDRQCFMTFSRFIDRRLWLFEYLSEKCRTAHGLFNKIENSGFRLASLSEKLGHYSLEMLREKKEQLAEYENACKKLFAELLARKSEFLGELCSRLEAVNPYEPLKRGYALININGKSAISIKAFRPGLRAQALFCDGIVEFEVLNTQAQPSICQEVEQE